MYVFYHLKNYNLKGAMILHDDFRLEGENYLISILYIMMERKKRAYNFVFNNGITSSYTGNRTEAVYRVDFKSIIPPESMNSSYLMTFRFLSYSHSSANFDPVNRQILLEASLGSQMRTSLNTTQTNIIGALSYVANTYPTLTTTQLALDTKPQDNPPTYIESIRDVTTIRLTLIDAYTMTKFTNANNYVCTLSFEEL